MTVTGFKRSVLLLPVAFLLVGCGRTYSDTDVTRALGLSLSEGITHYYTTAPPFATLAAVTDLYLDSGPVVPLGVYAGRGVQVERYGSRDAAWRALHQGRWLAFRSGESVTVARRGNLVLVGTRADVEATLTRLH